MTEEGDSGERIYGLHPVLEAIEAGKRGIDRIFVSREGGGHALGRLLRAAREAGIPVTHLPRPMLEKKAGKRAVHQGVAAIVSPLAYADPEALCREAPRPELLLALDGVEDPRNLGAALRSAAAAGVGGVLLGTEATVGLTPSALKTSAGAAERIAVAREPRLPRRLRALADRGVRPVALDPRGDARWDEIDWTLPTIVVAGGERAGLRRGILDACHARVAIPLAEGVESLNVSVAVAVVLYEAVRQRGRKSMPSS